MSNIIYEKLVKRRKTEIKKHLKRLSEAPESKDKFFQPGYAHDEYAEDMPLIRSQKRPKDISLFLSGAAMTSWKTPLVHQAAAFDRGDRSHLEVLFAHQMTRDYLVRQLELATEPVRGRRIFDYQFIPLVMGLYSIGWHEEADQVVRQIWDHPNAPLASGLGPKNLMAWFPSYFSLGSRELIEKATPPDRGEVYGEPNEPDSPYSFLLGCWKDPDPTKVRNALIAYSEQNMARSMLPPNKRMEIGFDIQSWWYVPWDILAINMRRKSLGLEWVETGDPRMEEVWQNREELPMVKDDLVWPAYLEICDILGVEPYQPRKSIEVKVNRENFDLEVIG